MSKMGEQIVVVLMAIIGVAVLAVLVSRNANTVGVINAAGGAFSGGLRAALSPLMAGNQQAAYAPVQPYQML